MSNDKGDEICYYCGEESAEEEIPNPNGMDSNPTFWEVCKTCKKIINLQQELSIEMFLGNGKEVNNIREKIRRISEESGKETFTAIISKEGSSE